MTLSPLVLAATIGLVMSASAQTIQTLPQGYLTKDGNQSHTWPWNNISFGGHRCMWIYDSTHIKSTGPILITKLRWRAFNSPTGSWIGGTHPHVTIALSTSPLDYKNASPIYANNHGQDRQTIFNGTVTVTASTHKNGRWYVEINLSTPFFYDPGKGDLVIDYIRALGTTGNFFNVDCVRDSTTTWTSKSNRIASYNSGTSQTGTVGPTAAICELTWAPAKGIFSSFSVDKMSGPSPLTVQFTDTTYTSSPGGVKTWAWDFDGDGKPDSTVQNPRWTYTRTIWDAMHDVTLTATDGVSTPSKKTRKGLITVDPSNAHAVNFGMGSTNKPVLVPLDQPRFRNHWNAISTTLGFHFVAPTNFVIDGFEAPNTYTPQETNQTVVCYVLAKPPTGGFTARAADIKFFGTGKANQIMKPTKPIPVAKGQWVGVLGACHASQRISNLRNSRGQGPFESAVLGQKFSMDLLTMKADVRSNQGLGYVVPRSGLQGRIMLHVSGNHGVPGMETFGLPRIGNSATLDLVGRVPGAQAGIVFLTTGRLLALVPTPFGNLLVTPNILASFSVPFGTGQFQLPIPNSSVLTGVKPVFQALVVDLLTQTYGMSNGVEWFLGR